MDEKIIDTLWQVKEGKKHPTTAYKEILQLISDNYVSKDKVKEFLDLMKKDHFSIREIVPRRERIKQFEQEINFFD
jgi:hypothetical protein